MDTNVRTTPGRGKPAVPTRGDQTELLAEIVDLYERTGGAYAEFRHRIAPLMQRAQSIVDAADAQISPAGAPFPGASAADLVAAAGRTLEEAGIVLSSVTRESFPSGLGRVEGMLEIAGKNLEAALEQLGPDS